MTSYARSSSRFYDDYYWHPVHPSDCMEYHVDSRLPFEDISCLLRHSNSSFHQFLSRTYMDWEFSLTLPTPSWNIIISTIATSAVMMLVGKGYFMASRPAFQIQKIVTLWNIVWCLVNAIGFLRLAPLVQHNAHHYQLEQTVCGPAASLWSSGTTGTWTNLWIYGKTVEVLVESLLVVLLKQPCGVMPWFHNYISPLIHGWHLQHAQIPGGIVVFATYYGVVALMNLYMGFYNLRQRQLPASPFLDALQTIQILSAVVLCVTTLHHWKLAVWAGRTCHANESHMRWMAFGWAAGHVVLAIWNRIEKHLEQVYLERLGLLHHQTQQRRLQSRRLRKRPSTARQTAKTLVTNTTSKQQLVRPKKKVVKQAAAAKNTKPTNSEQREQKQHSETQPVASAAAAITKEESSEGPGDLPPELCEVTNETSSTTAVAPELPQRKPAARPRGSTKKVPTTQQTAPQRVARPLSPVRYKSPKRHLPARSSTFSDNDDDDTFLTATGSSTLPLIGNYDPSSVAARLGPSEHHGRKGSPDYEKERSQTRHHDEETQYAADPNVTAQDDANTKFPISDDVMAAISEAATAEAAHVSDQIKTHGDDDGVQKETMKDASHKSNASNKSRRKRKKKKKKNNK